MKYLAISLFHPRVIKGGAQYVAKDLYDEAARDPKVHGTLLACIDGAAFPQFTRVGTPITALPDSENEYVMAGASFDNFYHFIHDPRRDKALRHFLKTVDPDVIHLHHSIWVGLETLRTIREVKPNAVIVYTLHEYIPICNARGQMYRYHDRSICRDPTPDQCNRCFPEISADDFFIRRAFFKSAFDLVDHFVSPSAYLRDVFIRWGINPEKISVIKNGHETGRPADWKPEASRSQNIFGYFGQYVDAKGINVLVEAAAEAARTQPVELRIYGGNKVYASPDYIKQIDRILETAPEGLKVVEAGAYSRDNVFELMCGVDWVVVPSVWPETFGLVVSEAWDARRPVIASRAGGLTERIRHGVNGLGFTPGSVSELTAVMLECAGNETLWTRMSQSITDEISLKDAWAQHSSLFQDLLARQEQAV